jgi:hypothetical protein
MKIEFKIDPGRYLDYITWDLQIAMESQSMTHAQEKELCAAFLLNEAGEFCTPEEANVILGKLTLRQKSEASSKLLAAIGGMAGAQNPLASQTGAALSTSGTTKAPPA